MTDERVAIVTGAGRGMGRAITLALAKRGVRVVVASRTPEQLEGTVAMAGDNARSFACDVADPDQVEALVGYALGQFGRVDVLVCSHGVYQGGATAMDLTLEQFDQTMAVNLRGSLICAQRAATAMRDGGQGGRIVFITSMNGQASQNGAVDYDVSKAALNGLTRALAVELAGDAITVNAIAPGWIRTEMSAPELEELEAAGVVLNPLHAVGTPEEIALAALWLTDPGNGFVTGAIINVDGGQTAMLPLPWDPKSVVAPGA